MNRIALAWGLLLLLVLAGCPMDTPAKSGEATTSAISISGFAFHPGTAHNVVGQPITFTNEENHTHRIVWDEVPSGATPPDSSDLGDGDTYSYTPTVAGTYQYHCGIHGSMKGTLIIATP